MEETKEMRKTIEKYLSDKLSEKEFGNIIDRGDMVLNIDKMLDDLVNIKEVRVLLLYSFNLIDILLTIGLRQSLFKHNIGEDPFDGLGRLSLPDINTDEYKESEFAKRCSKVIDDIIEKMSFDKKRQCAEKIFGWDRKISKIIFELQQLRNLIAHYYHISHQEFNKRRKDFQYVLFNKRSIIKNIIYLLKSDFINTTQ